MYNLDALYALYPRKRGKTPGMKKLIKEIKCDADYAALRSAIEHYAQSVKGTPSTYILHFSTFVSQWRDWVVCEIDVSHYSINVKPLSLEEL